MKKFFLFIVLIVVFWLLLFLNNDKSMLVVAQGYFDFRHDLPVRKLLDKSFIRSLWKKGELDSSGNIDIFFTGYLKNDDFKEYHFNFEVNEEKELFKTGESFWKYNDEYLELWKKESGILEQDSLVAGLISIYSSPSKLIVYEKGKWSICSKSSVRKNLSRRLLTQISQKLISRANHVKDYEWEVTFPVQIKDKEKASNMRFKINPSYLSDIKNKLKRNKRLNRKFLNISKEHFLSEKDLVTIFEPIKADLESVSKDDI